jgi:hypothetical protein
MSTPVAPQPAASPADAAGHPTRQLLDELDALMQRMLALPVQQLEEELRTAAAPALRVEEPVGEAGPESTALAPPATPAPDAAGLEEPARTDAAGDLTPPHSPLASFQSPPQGAPASPPEEMNPEPEKPDPVWEQLLPASPEVLAALGRPAQEPQTAEQAQAPGPAAHSSDGRWAMGDRRSVSVWLRPVLWINQAFDGCTALLGGPGRWLRGASGRSLVGWIGLGLLGGAAAWLVAYGFGWTW